MLSHFEVTEARNAHPSRPSLQMNGKGYPQAACRARICRVLGDAAYDAEHNHALCRDRLGIPETVFALNRRNTGRKWPQAPYRRSMRRAFPRAIYNQRWQVESALSRHKRRLGPFLRARSQPAQKAETLTRVLTHNLMLLAGHSP